MRLTEITQRKYDLWYGPERSIAEDHAHERTYLANSVPYDEAEEIAKKKLFNHKLGVVKAPEGTEVEIGDHHGPGRNQTDTDIGVASIWSISYIKIQREHFPPAQMPHLHILLCIVPVGWKGY